MIFLILSCSNSFSQDKNQNYIRTRVMLHESDTSKYIETIQYYDGLGRPFMNVQKGVTSDHKNNISLQEYDAAGREVKTWLPHVTTADYISPESLKNSISDSYNGDTRPFNESVYESSPLNRIVKQYAPGDRWGDYPASTSYMTNTSTGSLSCKLYHVTPTGELAQDGIYAQGELYVTKSMDEEGHISYRFIDKRNRELLNRQMKDSITHDTYYVYDDFDNKRFVLPPAFQSNPDLDLYAYQYTYDKRNRCVEKKLPGCATIKYFYDSADHLIFSQDGVQYENSELTFFLYDAFNRLTVKGICLNTNPSSVENIIVTCSTVKGIYDISISENLGSSGYKTNLKLTSPTVHEINYYDNYSFLSMSNFASTGKFHNSLINSTGFQTGQIIGLLGDTVSYLYSATYYDVNGRPIETISSNHIGGYDAIATGYSFTGKPLIKRHIHSNAHTSITEVSTFAYDHVERLKTITHQLDNNNPVTLVSNSYDDLGRLQEKKYHNDYFKTKYSYNIRNWLTEINASDFKEKLSYTLNGNISSMEYRFNDRGYRKYNYVYDDLNRLTGAYYSYRGDAGTSHSVNKASNYTVTYTYDKNGNIGSLRRYGAVVLDRYDIVDELIITYNGNQIKNITDLSQTNSSLFNSSDFKDSHSGSGTEYIYDANGNLEQDFDKKISLIQYNSLNLPTKLQFNNGNMTNYLYSTNGHKCRVTHLTAVNNVIIPMGSIISLPAEQVKNIITTDYCNNIIYENGVLNKILTKEGYITLEGDIPTYHYFQQDHLGNNRVIITQNGRIEEVNHYYPFGGIFYEHYANNVSAQPYKFGGKELDRMHGLGWYDFGSRFLRSDVPGWTGIDPLCEKYYNISPYAYCMNNPVRYIDPYGRDVYRFDDKTGEMILYKQTNDNFDQIGRFKYNKKTNTYILKTNKRGEARTKIDKIEKGILSDGMNLKSKSNVWEVGGKGQPTVEGFQNFAIGFSEMIGKELAGFYYAKSGQNDVSYIHMGKYENNRYDKSYSTPGIFSVRPELLGRIENHTSWHTHPSTAPEADRIQPSGIATPGGDMEHKRNHLLQGFHTFIILTKGYPPIYY